MTYLTDRIERMSALEPNTGCWLWLGSLGTNGYGATMVSGRKTSAHRASYEAHVGKIEPGKIVLHKCDTKSCVNPSHMMIGTHHDNVVDSVTKYPSRYRNVSKIDLGSRIEQMSVPEPTSGCWLWTGASLLSGYGEMYLDGRRVLGHRASYEAHVGPIPTSVLVLHKCDTRACVNPQHLELGTRKGRPRARTTGVVRSTTKFVPVDLKDRTEQLSIPEPNTGCHLWCGTVTKSTGYGEIKVDGRKTTGHRATWIAHHGDVPAGMVIMHSCDNRLCVNLDHLSVGTRRDNSRDMTRKGRGGFDRLSSEQRRDRAQRALETQGIDGLRARAALRIANTTPEERHTTALKVWDTRRLRTTPEQRHLKATGIWTPEMRIEHSERCKNGRRMAKKARQAAARPISLLRFNLLNTRFQPAA